MALLDVIYFLLNITSAVVTPAGGGGHAPYDTTWPSMTTDSAPAGYVMSASTFYAGDPTYGAFRAHDGSDATRWASDANVHNTGWIQVQFPTLRQIDTYTLLPYASSVSPRDWTLAGSQDGIAWTTIDTQSAQNQGTWTDNVARTFNVAGGSQAGYLYYRLTWTAWNFSESPTLFRWDATFVA